MSKRHLNYMQLICFACVIGLGALGCSETSDGSDFAQSDGGGLAINDQGVTVPPQPEADVVQVVPAGCTSDEQCRSEVTNLRPCQDVQCMDNGDCAVFPIADCCESDDDCPQVDDECIEAFCPAPGGTCATRSVCKLCETHADCIAIAESCEVGWCAEGGRCEFKQLEICCDQDSDCLLMDACIASQCFEGRCLYNAVQEGECCDTKPVYLVGADDEMDFIASSDNPTIYWHLIETGLTPSPPYALYVGNSDTMSTATIGDVNAVAVFDLGNLLEGAQLDFRAHAYVNLAKVGTQLFQVILTGEGVADKILYDSKAKKYDDWHLIHANVTVTSASYYSLVMRYYQKGSIIGAELGVLIDNLEIRKDCSPYFECFDDVECDDGDPCTVDSCNVGLGTASCLHTPSPPLDGVEEVCGDGQDNDCNPETFCVTVTAAGQSLSVDPVASGVNPKAFYNAASTNEEYASSNHVSVLLSENNEFGKAIHLILDQPNDGDGGNLTLNVSGGNDTNIVLYDDPVEEASDSWGYDPKVGEGPISWAWGPCCVDGMVMAPLKANQCILFDPKAYEGLTNLKVWQDASTSSTLPLGPFELCGSL